MIKLVTKYTIFILTYIIYLHNSHAALVSEPAWGYKFKTPEKWKYQKNYQGCLLGHEVIPGMIIVMPHQHKNINMIKDKMKKGIVQQNGILKLQSKIKTLNNNRFTATYTGYWDGVKVKSEIITTLSPNGGGAIIIASTTPDKFSKDIILAAKYISNNINYIKNDSSNLTNHFTGLWKSFTKNTESYVHLFKNGTYTDNYSSSYSGRFKDGYGKDNGYWGTAGSNNKAGTWKVKGTKNNGVITFINSKGESSQYNYRVNIENGRYFYNNYYIGGKLYFKE